MHDVDQARLLVLSTWLASSLLSLALNGGAGFVAQQGGGRDKRRAVESGPSWSRPSTRRPPEDQGFIELMDEDDGDDEQTLGSQQKQQQQEAQDKEEGRKRGARPADPPGHSDRETETGSAGGGAATGGAREGGGGDGGGGEPAGPKTAEMIVLVEDD